MQRKACKAQLSVIELICIQSGLSIYAGWVSTATIVGGSIMLKEFGMTYANGTNEAAWAVAMLWIALVIYMVNPLLNMDPLYGGVFIWACCAIRD